MHSETTDSADNIYRLAEELKIPERRVFDFSMPSNPLGVSKKIKAELRKHLKYLHHFPDPSAERLRRRIGQYHGIDPEMTVCGSGSMELLSLAVGAIRPEKVLIAGSFIPMYMPALPGVKVIRHELKYTTDLIPDVDDLISLLASHPSSLALVSNPDSITGLSLKKTDIRKMLAVLKESGSYLIIDEAFADFCPDCSVVSEVGNNPGLIVFRTMSFFYALAGLMISYAVFHPEVVRKIGELRESAAVNSLAQRAAAIALKDDVYRRETTLFMQVEKKFLEKGFRRLRIDFFPSQVNFYLLKIGNAASVYQKLKRKGFLVGACSGYGGLDGLYLRVAVGTHKANALLIKALAGILREENLVSA
ncbi:MAG TPA: histidinol-phosphate transaminase [Thermodesulfovibrionales bacterium]|nr:histidinol-phosphate transaminase [Thermodesulfovibrionales bacterium]